MAIRAFRSGSGRTKNAQIKNEFKFMCLLFFEFFGSDSSFDLCFLGGLLRALAFTDSGFIGPGQKDTN